MLTEPGSLCLVTSSPPCLGIVLTRRPRHRPSPEKSPCVCVVCVCARSRACVCCLCVCVCACVPLSVSFLRPSCDVQICRSTDFPLKVSLPLLFSVPPPPSPPPLPSYRVVVYMDTPFMAVHYASAFDRLPTNSGPFNSQAMFTVTG